MKILIFTEGTAIMHSSAKSVNREERVRQSIADTSEINDFSTYIPNGSVVEKLKRWKSQGAEIHYLTSRKTQVEIAEIQAVLTRYGFPDAKNLHFRREDETYASVAEELMPNLLIEDDCESIGGEAEMTYPHVSPESQQKITSVIVKEFEGIDHLPEDLITLATIEGSRRNRETR